MTFSMAIYEILSFILFYVYKIELINLFRRLLCVCLLSALNKCVYTFLRKCFKGVIITDYNPDSVVKLASMNRPASLSE